MPASRPATHPDGFDPLAPFATRVLLDEVVGALGAFRWKLYGPIPVRFHRGEPTPCEFDLNLGIVYVTEQDANGLSALFRGVNERWNTQMTYCVYPSKEKAREIILNVRGSPRAPSETD
jgi:hypothetical protein